MRKLSAAHQATVDCMRYAQRESLAQHFILKAMTTGPGKYGTLERVGSVYDDGDSWVWQMTFSPRLRDAVILETFKSKTNREETIRCFFLDDVRTTYADRSFDSVSVLGKLQTMYWHAVELERLEHNREAA